MPVKKRQGRLTLLLALLAALCLACTNQSPQKMGQTKTNPPALTLPDMRLAPEQAASAAAAIGRAPDQRAAYTTKEEVAAYIRAYGRPPDNYITKKEARALGWQGGSVQAYAPGKSIGGDVFGNFEGLLPRKKGRVYYECDIDTLGAADRGAKRIVFSNDGLIFYSGDHYQTFEQVEGRAQDAKH